ncbi:MAG: hypothetical protein ACK5JD_14240 [Mangrovibacterium sp.]
MIAKHSALVPTLLTMVLLWSCTTQNLVKLQPKDKIERWQSGEEMAVDSTYGIIYEVGFDRIENGYYWFDFNIINQSNMPLLVEPTQFTALPLDAKMNPLAGQAFAAVDPEQKISELEQSINRNEKVAKNRLGLTLLGIGASIVTNVLLTSDANPRNDNLVYPLTDAIMITTLGAGDMAEAGAYNQSQQKAAWENECVRKSTLEPNYSLSGKVFFPYNKKASYLKMDIPIDDASLEFMFMQLYLPPN